MVTQEQLISDKQIEDLRNYIQNLQDSHKNGVIDMEGHITVANGELSELRSLYQNLKIENNQQKKRIIELEIELKKTYEQWEKERNEWKSLLASEQENWDKRRVELISREMSLRKTIEEQMVNLENTIDSSTKKLFENEKNMQDRNSELAMLREKNTDLEQKLRNESCFSNEYKTKYDKIYESLIDERKQNVKLAEEINELKMKLNTPSKK